MTDQSNLQNLIIAMRSFPNQLRAQVHRLHEPELSFRPAPHEWSILENIGHLIDVDVVMRGRIGKIIAAENPMLQAMDTEEYVRKANYQQKNAVSLLNSFAEHRAELIEELRFLQPAALSRTGTHPTRGAVSIMDIIMLLARHDETHSQQIEQTLAAYHSLHDRVID